MKVLSDGGYAISDMVSVQGGGVGDFVFSRGWLLEIVELTGGEYYFISDGKHVRSRSNRFGVFYPPFTFVRAGSENMKGRILGVGSETLLPGLPSSPFIFETDCHKEFTKTAEALDVLDRCSDRRSILINTRPSPITVNTKRLIDENYLIYPSIARIADRLEVSHEHLSRQFKKDFEVTPSAYLHKLRVADATFRLSLGQEIIEISQDVGYNDLSRFYKQFRKATRTSPAACRKQVFS